MKINFKQKLKNIFGKPIEMKDTDGKLETLTLGKVSYESLLAPSDEKGLPPKFELFKLAKKATEEKPIEITAEEITQLKKMIELSGWSTLVVGSAFEIIEGLK